MHDATLPVRDADVAGSLALGPHEHEVAAHVDARARPRIDRELIARVPRQEADVCASQRALDQTRAIDAVLGRAAELVRRAHELPRGAYERVGGPGARGSQLRRWRLLAERRVGPSERPVR